MVSVSKTQGAPMNQKVFKAVRLPLNVVKRVQVFTDADGSTFSQFVRTAVLKELTRRAGRRPAA